MNDITRYNSRLKEPALPRASLVAWALGVMLLTFVLWANFFTLDEVTTGAGKVVPSSREQVIQSLEGGILYKLDVREGDIVEKGQVLAQLDRTKTESGVQESESRLHAAMATAARLKAEVSGTALVFPEMLPGESELVRQETALYNSRRSSLEKGVAGLREAISLVQRELAMTQPLVKQGAASSVEVLRLAETKKRAGKQNYRNAEPILRARARRAGEN